MRANIEIEPTVLVYRAGKLTPIERVVVPALLFLVTATALYVLRWNDLQSEGVLQLAWRLILKHPETIGVVLLGIGASLLVPLQMRKSRIHIDSAGLQFRSLIPYIGPLTERKIVWANVTSAMYVPASGMLTLRSSRGLPWALRATDWRLPDQPRGGGQAADEPELVQIVRRLGLMESGPTVAAVAAEFDLMADGRTRFVVALGALLGLYAATDGLANSESWAFFDVAYVIPHVVVAAALALVAGMWLFRKSEAPALHQGIVVGLAIFIAVVGGPASWVAGVRLNQWLGGPLEAQEYHRDSTCMNLVPVKPDLPVIEYTEVTRPYWCHVPQTRAIQVLVRRGLFGLYQVNLEAQTDEIRRFRGGR